MIKRNGLVQVGTEEARWPETMDGKKGARRLLAEKKGASYVIGFRLQIMSRFKVAGRGSRTQMFGESRWLQNGMDSLRE